MAKFIWDKKKKKAILASKYENETSGSPRENSNFAAMTDEQLAEYAALKGVDISKCKKREDVIEKLEKAEQGTE